jgi:serine/threonine protein kinase
MGNYLSDSSTQIEVKRDTTITKKWDIFTNDMKKCVQHLINFTSPQEGVEKISKYINDGDHSLATRKQLYQYFDTTLGIEGKGNVKNLLGGGTYGDIYSYGTTRVLKIPLGDIDDKADALIEIISNIVYQCYKERILELVPTSSNFRWPFPNISRCSKYTITKNGETQNKIGLVMSKMTKDCWDLVDGFTGHHEDIYILLDILFQLCIFLFGLQKSIGFIHRDLHPGNIMYDILHTPIQAIYRIEGNEVEMKQYTKAYIIDLGQSCANLSKCIDAKCTNANYLLEGPASSYKTNPIDGCFNESYDIRMFVGALSISYLETKHAGKTYRQMEELLLENESNTPFDNLMIQIFVNAFDFTVDSKIEKKIPSAGSSRSGSSGSSVEMSWKNQYNLLKTRDRGTFSPKQFFMFLKGFMEGNPPRKRRRKY